MQKGKSKLKPGVWENFPFGMLVNVDGKRGVCCGFGNMETGRALIQFLDFAGTIPIRKVDVMSFDTSAKTYKNGYVEFRFGCPLTYDGKHCFYLSECENMGTGRMIKVRTKGEREVQTINSDCVKIGFSEPEATDEVPQGITTYEGCVFGDRVTVHKSGRPDRYGIFINELSGGLIEIRFRTKREFLELPKITKGWPGKTKTGKQEKPGRAELAFGDQLFYENEAVLFIRLNPQEKREAVVASVKKMFYAPVKYLIRPDDMPLADFEPETVATYSVTGESAVNKFNGERLRNAISEIGKVAGEMKKAGAFPAGGMTFDKTEDESKTELSAIKKDGDVSKYSSMDWFPHAVRISEMFGLPMDDLIRVVVEEVGETAILPFEILDGIETSLLSTRGKYTASEWLRDMHPGIFADEKTCVPCEIPESSDGVISHGLRKNEDGEFVPDYAGIVDRMVGYSAIIEADVQKELNLPQATKRLRRLTNALAAIDKAVSKVEKLR